MNWLIDDCKTVAKREPYFWIAEAKRDARREKRRKKRRVGILDFRSVVVTLTTVGVVVLFQNIHKEGKEFELSNLKYAYKDFEEVENRAIENAIILRFDIGNFDLNEEYNYSDSGIDLEFLYNFFLALDTKSPKKARTALNHYDESIYKEMSSFEVTNKRLAEKTKNVTKIAKNINNKDSLTIADSTMFIYSMLESHRDKLQEILKLQREMLEVIEKGVANKREGELSIAQEQIKEYYVDLNWQEEKISEAHNKINESFSNLKTE